MRDVIIAGKDEEVDDARKLLKETKDKQKQLGTRCVFVKSVSLSGSIILTPKQRGRKERQPQ